MPLGKLTRRQIERAYSTLGEAQRVRLSCRNEVVTTHTAKQVLRFIPQMLL